MSFHFRPCLFITSNKNCVIKVNYNVRFIAMNKNAEDTDPEQGGFNQIGQVLCGRETMTGS